MKRVIIAPSSTFILQTALTHSLYSSTLFLDDQLFLDSLEVEPQLESFENFGRTGGVREFDFGNVRVSNLGNPFGALWRTTNERRFFFPSDGEYYISFPGLQDYRLLYLTAPNRRLHGVASRRAFWLGLGQCEA